MDTNTKKSNSKINPSYITLFLLISVMTLYFSYVAFVMLLVGFTPTFVAFFVDKTNERFFSLTVFGGNLMGIAIPLISAFQSKSNMIVLSNLISNVYNWFWILSGSAMGWLIYLIIPPIIEKMMYIADKVQIDMVLSEQKKILDEWGDEIKAKD